MNMERNRELISQKSGRSLIDNPHIDGVEGDREVAGMFDLLSSVESEELRPALHDAETAVNPGEAVAADDGAVGDEVEIVEPLEFEVADVHGLLPAFVGEVFQF